MSYILNIETSSKNCSISISKDNILLALVEDASDGYKHSENIHPFIEKALQEANISLENLSAICVGKGPGSYTGLRIGTSTAKGFCFGLDIPLLSINSLEIVGHRYEGYDYIIPIMDARRMELYTCTLDAKGNVVKETEAHILNENSFAEYQGKKILFVGDAVEKTENYLNDIKPDFTADFIFAYPSAGKMVETANNKLKSGVFEDVAYFVPFYLKEWK